MRNDRRLGLVGNWRRAFEVARERFPQARYFAWASDHDVWEEGWLEALVMELEAHPDAVLTYPGTRRISESGELLRGEKSFDTSGLDSPYERLRSTFGDPAFTPGDLVYGLYRVEELERAGAFPLAIGPDRLLLAELILRGHFRQVPEPLWSRRVLGAVSQERQRSSFVPGRRPPLHLYLPWWLTHAAVLAWRLGIRKTGAPAVGRIGGLRAALSYAARGFMLVTGRRLQRRRKRWRRFRRRVAGRLRGRR